MKIFLLCYILFGLSQFSWVEAQGLFDLEELQNKSNEFTKSVMQNGIGLDDKIQKDIAHISLDDFKLIGEDSIALIKIYDESIKYYDYLLNYKNTNGLTIDNLSSLLMDSKPKSKDDFTCFEDWYCRDTYIVVRSLTCYQSELDDVKRSCIVSSIQPTIVNNTAVAKCIKSQQESEK